MGVFFAHWAKAELAARILCQSSGMPLNFVLNLLFFPGRISWTFERNGKGYIAVPAYEGSLAEA
eukprot:698449-Pelagomonas_calceolata.AAC.1